MNPMGDTWLFLKGRVKSGFYRHATIPDNIREPVTKVSRNQTIHPFANRFDTLALAQSLKDMGKPIEPETPIKGGGVEQRQMDSVFPGAVNYGGNEKIHQENAAEVRRIQYSPLMQMLGLADTKPQNVGMKDNQLTIFDPAFRTFRGHKIRQYGKPLDFDNYTAHKNILDNVKNVPSEELADLTQGIKDYRPQFDAWQNDGDLRNWQSGIGDYHAARDTLTYLNSLRQDPQQTKLFEHEGFGDNPQEYSNLVQNLRGE